MCGRFTLALSPEEVARLLELERALDAELAGGPRWNVAPGTEVLAGVRSAHDAPTAPRRLRWGLIPPWARDPRPLINARSETVREKPAFREAFARRRCLVPADGFYEWKREGKGRRPWFFTTTDGPGFTLAGIWERRVAADGEVLESCALLTTAPNALMAPVHDRMPVIVAPRHRGDWLGADPAQAASLLALLAPYPAEAMRAHPVSPRVNSPREDDAGLVEPVDPEPPASGQLSLL